MPLSDYYTKQAAKEELNRPFAWILCKLQESKEMKGQELAELINLSVESVSKLRKGKTRPRASTFQRLLEVLCENESERKLFRRAYDKPLSINLKFEDPPTDKVAKAERKKAFMEMATRTQPLRYKTEIREVLEELAIPFEVDYMIGDTAADFMFTLNFEDYDSELGHSFPNPRQFALLCDLNPNAQLTAAMSNFVQASLFVDEVMLVVPHVDGTPHLYTPLKDRRMAQKKWRESFDTLKNQKLSSAEHARKQKALVKKRPSFNRTLTPESLKLYLGELKASSVPPATIISREVLELPERVRASLTARKITHSKKIDGPQCVVRPNKTLIGLIYSADLDTSLKSESKAAVELRNRLKLYNVVIVIPETEGISFLKLQSGIRVVPISELSAETLGLKE